MASIHIDEASGSDSTGTGTIETPYQSLAQAIFAHGEAASFKIRKTAEKLLLNHVSFLKNSYPLVDLFLEVNCLVGQYLVDFLFEHLD